MILYSPKSNGSMQSMEPLESAELDRMTSRRRRLRQPFRRIACWQERRYRSNGRCHFRSPEQWIPACQHSRNWPAPPSRCRRPCQSARPWLRLLQHQFFINRADLGLFLVSLLAASAIFFRRRHRNVVLEVAHARSVFGVNLQGMLKALQVDALALHRSRASRVLVHSATVAFLCMFSMICRQPTPVLYAQNESHPAASHTE